MSLLCVYVCAAHSSLATRCVPRHVFRCPIARAELPGVLAGAGLSDQAGCAGPGRPHQVGWADSYSLDLNTCPQQHVQYFATGADASGQWLVNDNSYDEDDSWGYWTSATGAETEETVSPWSGHSWSHWDSSDAWHDSLGWGTSPAHSCMYVNGAPPWFTDLSSEVHHSSLCVVQSGCYTAGTLEGFGMQHQRFPNMCNRRSGGPSGTPLNTCFDTDRYLLINVTPPVYNLRYALAPNT